MKKWTSVSWLVIAGFLMLTVSAQAQWGDWKKLAEKAKSKNSNTKKTDTKKTDSSNADSNSEEKSSTDEKKADSSEPAEKTNESGDAKPENSTSATTGGQPNMSAVKIDFVPGEKTIFYDDFSDMAPDEPPPHWKWRGDGPVNLMIGNNGVHELSIDKGGHLISGKIPLPENFTVELSAVVYKGSGNPQLQFMTNPNDTNPNSTVSFNFQNGDEIESDVDVGSEGSLGKGHAKVTPGQPFTVAFWAQNGRMRVYLNGERIVDANQVKFPPTSGIRIRTDFYGGAGPLGIRSLRIAESTPDASSMLASTGKFITHGINFDVNSDHLKPESAPVIKEVAGALIKNPNLKLEVDGYTDSTGDAAKNLDLSKRRAAAVETVLVSQFGIDASRLKSNGFGDGKPMASNDSAEGRAQNRRVEFVKQ